MSEPEKVTKPTTPGSALAHDLIERIDDVLQAAVASGQPLELDPQRAQLFELFVMCDAAGFLEPGAEQDLTCDGIARELAVRWDLARNLGGALPEPGSVEPAKLRPLRLLWSFMRMWMEWTYAWQRWEEFHQASSPTRSPAARKSG